MHRVFAVCALLAATGCGDGKVKASAVDFGKVKSAEWMERKLITESGDDIRHDFVLTTFGGWCKTANQIYPQLASAWVGVQDVIASDPSDATAICEAKRSFYTEAAGLTGDLDRGFSTMRIQLRHPSESLAEPPAIGSYDEAMFDAALPYVAARIDVFASNPYGHYADSADCEGNPNFWESDADDALLDMQQSWILVEGSADADKPNPDAYTVDLEGSLEDRAGKAAGDVAVKATFEHCELVWDGDFPEFW